MNPNPQYRRRARLRPVAWTQVVAIVVAGTVLGLAYNARNPIGIRWTGVDSTQVAATAPATNSAAVPTAPSVQADVPAVKPAAAPGTNSSPAAVPPQYAPPSPTTWAEIKPRAEKQLVVLVDARARSAYDAGHIPGAVNLPEPPPEAEFAAFRAQYPTNSHIVIYCSSTSCSLSFKLAHRLARDAGYGFVQYMTGGFLEWQREETLGHGGGGDPKPAPTPADARVPAVDLPAIDPPVAPLPTGQKSETAWPIRWSQVRSLLATGQAVLIDARAKADFETEHIPGAIWVPSDAAPELVHAALGGRPRTTRFVTYCETTGCAQAFQLAVRLVTEFDFPNAQYMTEGLAQWKRAEPSGGRERAAR